MRKIYSSAVVDPALCNGDKICENICVTKAIAVEFALFILSLLFYGGCSLVKPDIEKEAPQSGRDLVCQALSPSRVNPTVLKKSGVVATAFSSTTIDPTKPLKGLDPNGKHGGEPFNMELRDGTRVGGLFFEYDNETGGPSPLIMASFGFLQDRWGSEAAKFYELYMEDPEDRIPAHVLILDHPTAGPFMANNGHLSMGSYDDARMWIEVAQRIGQDRVFSGIHLLGVSMSGQTVVHALIEDKRLGLGLFRSGMAFSIAPDYCQVPGRQLAQLKTPEGTENPWKDGCRTVHMNGGADAMQAKALLALINKQFVPHYHEAHPEDREFDIKSVDVPVFLRKACDKRISFLRKQNSATWSKKDFSLASLESFMTTTRIARVIGRVETPLVLVSCHDDPAVDHRLFEEVVLAAADNPWVAAYETKDGGHFGFNVVYGKDYLGRIIRLMLEPNVLDTWNVRQ